MTCEEVIFSICDYSKEFITKYENPRLEKKVIDAVVVDFVNFFAVKQCCIDLAMYTSDLRDKKQMCDSKETIQKDIVQKTLFIQKDKYYKNGIINSINRNNHMNDCGGNIDFDESEALNLLNEFVNGYTTF